MLKEIKNERDVITNVDLFNEIILKQVYMIMRLNLVLF